jgi:hypothetical protein
MNNAIINVTLNELFDVMDPRARVNIFKKTEDGKEKLLISTELYRVLSDDEFIGKYGYYKITGFIIYMRITSILIKEA